MGATSLLLAGAACETGGGASDAGSGTGGPIVIQATERELAEALDTCGGCHAVLDEVRVGEASADVAVDLRLHLEHADLMLARDLGEP